MFRYLGQEASLVHPLSVISRDGYFNSAVHKRKTDLQGEHVYRRAVRADS